MKHAPEQASLTTDLPTSPPDTIIVHGEGIKVDRALADIPRIEAYDRFNGVRPLAVLAGSLCAIGATLLLSALLAPLLQVGFINSADQDLTTAELALGSLVLALSLLLGGWTAARSARYDGGVNGVCAGALFLLFAIGLGALSAATDEIPLSLPSLSDLDFSAAALLTGLLVAVLVLLFSWLGGRLGQRWHKKADTVLVNTRFGGLSSPAAQTPYPEAHR